MMDMKAGKMKAKMGGMPMPSKKPPVEGGDELSFLDEEPSLEGEGALGSEGAGKAGEPLDLSALSDDELMAEFKKRGLSAEGSKEAPPAEGEEEEEGLPF